MLSEISSSSTRAPSRQPKPARSSVPEMLTPSEIEQLLQDARELNDYYQKAFRQTERKQSQTAAATRTTPG